MNVRTAARQRRRTALHPEVRWSACAAALAGLALSLALPNLGLAKGKGKGDEKGYKPCRPAFPGPSNYKDRNLAVLEFYEAFYGKIPKGCNFEDTKKCGPGPAHVFQWTINHSCEGHPDCQSIYADLFSRANELQVQRSRLRCDPKARELLRKWNSELRNLGKWIKCEWQNCHGGMTCLTGPGFQYTVSRSLDRFDREHVRGPWFCGDFVCDTDPARQTDEKLVNPCPNKIVDTLKFCVDDKGGPVTWKGAPEKGFHRDDTMWGSADVCRRDFPDLPPPGKGKLQQLINSAAD